MEFQPAPDEAFLKTAAMQIQRSSSLLTGGEKTRFAVGARVRHAIFGAGEIIDVDMEKSAYVIRFDELETPRRIAFRGKLEGE